MADPLSFLDASPASPQGGQPMAAQPTPPQTEGKIGSLLDQVADSVHSGRSVPSLAKPAAQAEPDTGPIPTYQSPYKNAPDLTVGQTAAGAVKNLPASAGTTLASLYSAVIHPIETGKSIASLGRAVSSKIEGAAGRPQDPEQKRRIEAPADMLMAAYKDKYGDLRNFKYALATDPASVLLDLSAIATGGETAAANIAKLGAKVGATGAAGAAGTVSRALGTTARATNVLNPVGMAKTVLGAAKPAAGGLRSSAALDTAIRQATNGMHDMATLTADPARAQILRKVIAEKGPSEAAVREAIVRMAGGDPTLTMTAGIAPSGEAAAAHAQRVAENARRFSERVGDISGGPASPYGIAESLENSRVRAANNASSLYEKAFSHQGEFNPSIGGADLHTTINDELSKIPGIGAKTTRDFGQISMGGVSARFPQSEKAIQFLDQELPGTGAAYPLDMSRMEEIRRSLNGLMRDAEGEDIRAMRAIIDGFDRRLEEGATSGLWSGQTGAELAQDMRAARNGYKDYMSTFIDPSGENRAISSISKSNQTRETFDPVTGERVSGSTTEDFMGHQKALGRELMDPAKGPALYNKLVNALGDSTEVDNFLRQNILRLDAEGHIAMKPAQLEEVLRNPNGLAQRVFTPEEINELRIINQARRVNALSPTRAAERASLISGIGKKAASLGAKGAALYAGSHFGPAGPILGYMVESGAERALAKRAARKELERELAGAPVAGRTGSGIRSTIGSTYGAVTNPITGEVILNADEARRNLEYPTGRVGRASGGRISSMNHAAKAASLVAAAEKARKAHGSQTEAILDQPDAIVAKALAKANDAI